MPFHCVTSRFQAVANAIVACGALAIISGCSDSNFESRCADLLGTVNRLIVVQTPDTQSVQAKVVTLVRSSPKDAWRIVGHPKGSVVGQKGLAWGKAFQSADTDGVGMKQEGDKKTPAGLFRIGRPFGFSSSTLTGYLQLETDQHICVDDVTSSHYGRIVSRDEAGAGTNGEAMREIDVYRNGIIVDYPPDRQAKSGSCIFLHVWTSPEEGTSGCVALREQDIQRLQAFSTLEPTAIAIWPKTSQTQLQTCLGEVPKALFDPIAEPM